MWQFAQSHPFLFTAIVLTLVITADNFAANAMNTWFRRK